MTKLYENGDICKEELSHGLPHNQGKMEFTYKEIDYIYVSDFINGLNRKKGIYLLKIINSIMMEIFLMINLKALELGLIMGKNIQEISKKENSMEMGTFI